MRSSKVRFVVLWQAALVCAFPLIARGQHPQIESPPISLPSLNAFGNSVAIDGGFALVGVKGVGTFDESGVVAYRNEGGTWVYDGTLIPSHMGQNATFSLSVAISGDTALIGVPGEDYDGFSNSGAAYIFRRMSGVWVQTQRFVPLAPAHNLEFGGQVRIDGNVAIVTAASFSLDSTVGLNVYRLDGVNWVHEIELSALIPVSGPFDFWETDLSEDWILVSAHRTGAIYNDHPVYAFNYNGSVWQYSHTLQPVGNNQVSGGGTVRMSGEVAFVSSPRDPQGSTFVFRLIGATWTHEQEVENSYVLSDGNESFLVVAAGSTSSIKKIYGFNGSTWQLRETIHQSYFGNPGLGAVAVSGEWAIIALRTGLGGPLVVSFLDIDGNDCNVNGQSDRLDIAAGGSLDCSVDGIPDECQVPPLCAGCDDCNANSRPDACESIAVGTPTPLLPAVANAPNDGYAFSVAVSGDTAMVGAPDTEVGGPAFAHAGAVYA